MLINNHILQENRPLNASKSHGTYQKKKSKSHGTFVCASDGASFHQDRSIRYGY